MKKNLICLGNCFHLRDFTEKKSFQNSLVLNSRPFGKLKKFLYEGLFPFYDYDLYVMSKYMLSWIG